MLPFASRRLTFLALTSAALLFFVLDQTTQLLDPGRLWLNKALAPFFEIARLPGVGQTESSRMAQSKLDLIQDIAHLETQGLARAFELQKLATLRAENESLKSLLDLEYAAHDKPLVAQVLLIRVTPLNHKMVLNKGLVDGVVKGSVVFDADGVVGQVHFTGEHQSWVTLISDPRHGVPAVVNRSALRGVIQGVGTLDLLSLHYIPETSDIKLGDSVVTSGIGGRFPPGYPLGTVARVKTAEQQPFATVDVVPQSQLAQLRFVLVIEPLVSNVVAKEQLDDDLLTEKGQ